MQSTIVGAAIMTPRSDTYELAIGWYLRSCDQQRAALIFSNHNERISKIRWFSSRCCLQLPSPLGFTEVDQSKEGTRLTNIHPLCRYQFLEQSIVSRVEYAGAWIYPSFTFNRRMVVQFIALHFDNRMWFLSFEFIAIGEPSWLEQACRRCCFL